MTFEKRVTIKQVAREAGVSPQTVSRVVNNHPDVSPETRERVQLVINRLAFQPSYIARTLIQGHSRTLGVVGTGLEYFGPSRALSGIEQQADELGYTLQLSLIRQPERSDVEQLWRDLLSRHVEGVIWAVPEIGNNRKWVQQVIGDNGVVHPHAAFIKYAHNVLALLEIARELSADCYRAAG